MVFKNLINLMYLVYRMCYFIWYLVLMFCIGCNFLIEIQFFFLNFFFLIGLSIGVLNGMFVIVLDIFEYQVFGIKYDVKV